MITLDQVHKTYTSDTGAIAAVAPTSLQVERGEIFGIIGRSGAGKSTLLRLINLLEQPTGGRVYVDRQEITSLEGSALRSARRAIGMIFQHFNLLHNRSVLSNVAVPLEIAGASGAEAGKRAAECLEWVGLGDKAHAYPAQSSGEQKQRVAIARALAPNPKVLLCDEPTSGLDPHPAESILTTLQYVNRSLGVTVVIVTQSLEVVRRICNSVAIMERGRIVEHIRLADLMVAPRSELGRLLFARPAAPKDELKIGVPEKLAYA
ncbi:MAG: ATP-binding cassette domain-containing protein [Betaproteobacteria bacterium]